MVEYHFALKGQGMAKVLVIDDDKLVRLSVRQSLEDAGHQVEEAQDGRAGLKIYSENRTYLVITDIIMPEVEGVEIILSLLQSNPDCRIIAISGGGRIDAENYLRVAEHLGVDAVISKPFEETTLMERVNAVLST